MYNVGVCIFIYGAKYTCVYVCVCVCVYACVYIHVYVCQSCVCVYLPVCKFILYIFMYLKHIVNNAKKFVNKIMNM